MTLESRDQAAARVTDGHGEREGSVAAVAANVERYTVRPVPPGPVDPVDVVIILPDGEIATAFERAREVARARGSVRLVGHGVTLRSSWPPWVATEPSLVLSELGAYRSGNPMVATAKLRSSYREWIGKVFAGAAPPGAAAHIYYGPVAVRLFQAAFEAEIFVGGIAAVHARSRLHFVGDERRAFDDIMDLQAPTAASRARELAVRPVVAAAWLGALAITLAGCVRMRVEARESFAELGRRAERATDEPLLWLGLLPDWDRMNNHLLKAGAMPELERAGRLGVLLTGTLRSGMRDEHAMKTVRLREELWPALGALRAELDRCTVEQAIQPSTRAGHARALGAFVAGSASVAWRMLRHDEPLRALARGGGLRTIARRAAATATVDVARSIFAERGARELVKKHDFGGRMVVFAAANGAGYTSVEWVLRGAGATTLEHTHGSGGHEFYAGNESAAAVQCMWTEPEGRLLGAVRPCIVGGMPAARAAPVRTSTKPRRVLLLSNYVHRDRPYRVFPSEPFQRELLRVPGLLREVLGPELEFRWRPHPADEDEAIRHALADLPFVALSRNRPLADDLDESDVIVSGQSTALVEAVLADVPFFVQIVPDAESDLSWVPRERRFFRAEEVIAPFVAWASARSRGDASANEPDRRAREALFGPTGEPRSLHDALELLAADESAR